MKSCEARCKFFVMIKGSTRFVNFESNGTIITRKTPGVASHTFQVLCREPTASNGRASNELHLIPNEEPLFSFGSASPSASTATSLQCQLVVVCHLSCAIVTAIFAGSAGWCALSIIAAT